MFFASGKHWISKSNAFSFNFNIISVIQFNKWIGVDFYSQENNQFATHLLFQEQNKWHFNVDFSMHASCLFQINLAFVLLIWSILKVFSFQEQIPRVRYKTQEEKKTFVNILIFNIFFIELLGIIYFLTLKSIWYVQSRTPTKKTTKSKIRPYNY